MSNLKHPVTIRPLTKEEGGGYLAEFPDLPGCIADGETVEQALHANVSYFIQVASATLSKSCVIFNSSS